MPFIFFLAVILLFLGGIINLLAFEPLLDRKKSGWNLIFYGSVLSAVSTIVGLIFGNGDLGGLIGIIVTFWLLFEVRGQYKA